MVINDVTKEKSAEIKAKIRWTIEFEYPIFDGENEYIKSYLENSHCNDNFLKYLVSQSEDGYCSLCLISDVKVLEIVR